MEFRDLEIFLEVVRNGSFTRAARKAYLSQPAVSLAVRRLELELGTALIVRKRGEARPTRAGRILLDHATALLGRRDAARWEIGAWSGLEAGELRLGTTDAVSVYLFPQVYEGFRRRYPRVALRVRVDASAPLASEVIAGSLDLAVLTLPAPLMGLSTQPVEEEQLVVVTAPTHSLARRRVIAPRVLDGEVMIGYPRGSVTRRVIDGALAGAGAHPRIEMEMGSPEAMKRLVEVGLGLAILPRNLVEEEVRSGRLRALSCRGLRITRRLGFAHAEGRTLSPAAVAFIETTFEVLAGRAKRTRALQNAGKTGPRRARRRSP